MSLSGVTQTIKDGGLGVASQGGGQIVAKLGICSLGTNNVVMGIGSMAALRAFVGVGPLAEAVAIALAAGCKEVRVARANPSTLGTPSAVTHTGPGTGTVAAAAAPHVNVLAKVTTGGTLGTAQVAFSVDGGAYGTPVNAGPNIPVPGTLIQMTFPAGTYVLNEVYTAAPDNTVVTQSGGGPLPTRAASPIDGYDVRTVIVAAGGLGAGTFRYSTDGGDNYSGETLIPGTGRFSIPGTGIVLTFSGTFTALDGYNFTTTAASYNTSEAQSALDALIADPADWTHVHVVGAPTNSAGFASLAAAIDAKLIAAQALFKYKAAIAECPTSENDSTISSAVASLALVRTMGVAGDGEIISQYTGKTDRRNMALVISARAGIVAASRSLAAVKDGPLPFMGTTIYRNEAATPGLDNARLTCARTHEGKAGFYVNIDRTMASAGSDFTFWPRRRVMDEGCKAAYAALVEETADDVLVKADGTIAEDEAQSIEKACQRKMIDKLRGQVSAVKCTVDRTINVLTTNTISIDVGIQPKGLAYFVTETIQYIPTSLAA